MTRGMFLVVMSVWFLGAAACEEEQEPSGMEQALGALSAENVGVYSYSFMAEPPFGVGLHALAVLPEVGDLCAIGGDEDLLPSDFWLITLRLGDDAAGTYLIDPEFLSTQYPLEAYKDRAELLIKHVNMAEEMESPERFQAVSGTIYVEEAHEFEANPGSTALNLSIDALFSSWSATGCEDAQSQDGTFLGGTCQCENRDGQTEECALNEAMSTTSTDCCTLLDGPEIHFAAHLTLEYCSLFCDATDPELMGYCAELD